MSASAEPESVPEPLGASAEGAASRASTHTEIYRRFRGKLRPAPVRALPLFFSGWRAATKRKLALILFVPPLIGAVIFSFVVYAKFSLESGSAPEALGGGASSPLLGAAASALIEVRNLIVQCNIGLNLFSILIMSWYGAGLIAEDRRLGAHLLYFARPLTRLDYLLGKFLIVVSFGLLAALVPGLIICLVATLSSPHWSFVTEQSRVIFQTLAFGCLWSTVIGGAILTISSLAGRKTFALVGTFGFFMMTWGVALLLANLERDRRWMMLSPILDLRRVAVWMFGTKGVFGPRLDWDVQGSWWSLLIFVAACWAITFQRVRRMEIVA
jgi:ABC-type transport system involved in multi-copper enzyme maturation permease subunit